MDYYRVPEYSRKEIVMTNSNSINLTPAQMSYITAQVWAMGESYIDVCKDLSANPKLFSKVLGLIADEVYKNMLDKIDAADSINASTMSNIDKCRSLIESWWTLSEVDAQTISLFLDCGGFSNKNHWGWIADAAGKQVDRLYMHKLVCVLGVVIYAILYV